MTGLSWFDVVDGLLEVLTLLVLFHLAVRLRELTSGTRAALQNVQVQLSFIAGRIGLRNLDLQAATQRGLESPEQAPAPEVLGGDDWNDTEEYVNRVERGEIEPDAAER